MYYLAKVHKLNLLRPQYLAELPESEPMCNYPSRLKESRADVAAKNCLHICCARVTQGFDRAVMFPLWRELDSGSEGNSSTQVPK